MKKIFTIFTLLIMSYGVMAQDTTSNRMVLAKGWPVILHYLKNNNDYLTSKDIDSISMYASCSECSAIYGLFTKNNGNNLYAVLDTNYGAATRNIYEINPFTGKKTLIMPTGGYFSSLDITTSGRVYGVVGGSNMGGTNSGDIYEFDLANKTKSFYKNLPNYGQKPALTYNPQDTSLYIFYSNGGSSDSVAVLNLNNNTSTKFELINYGTNQIGGAYYYAPDTMIVVSWNGTFDYFKISTKTIVGQASGNSFPSNNFYDIAKINMILSAPTRTFCAGDSTLLIAAYKGGNYQWYKNGLALAGKTGDSLYVNSTGNYKILAMLNVGKGIWSESINVSTVKANYIINSPILCHGGTATLTISASGGAMPYSVTSPYTVPMTIPNVPANNYGYLVITDANGCKDSVNVIVTQPTAVVPNITSTTILCNGNSSTVTVVGTGGTSPYTGEITQTKTAGTYSYSVTDANSCIGTASVTISQPTAFTASTSTTAVLCNGGSSTITVTGNGGVTPYSGEVVETQIAGTYNYSLTDDNGCVANTSVTVSEPALLAASSSVTSAIVCKGGTGVVTVVATGGTAPYSLNGAQTVSAGTYNYTITDNNGCSTTTSGNVSEPSTAVVISLTNTPILCNGGTSTVVISANGGTSPYTGEGSFTANGGSFTYSVTDDIGCTVDTTGSISEPTALAVNITSSTIMCYGDSSTIVVNGSGATAPYSGELTENQMGGTYSYTLTDDNGCSATQSVTITEPSPNVTNQTVTICPGGMVAVGTSMYMSAGTYTDTLVSVVGCDSIVNTAVSVYAAVVKTVTVNNETITADEVGATYQWVDCDNAYAPISGETAQSFTATSNGNFAVIVSANGCSSDTSVCTQILTVGVKATANTNLFKVYPNPNNGAFTISTNVAGVYNIVNELGQVAESLKLSNSNIYNINLNVANGVYYVVGYNRNNDVVKQKIVVLK